MRDDWINKGCQKRAVNQVGLKHAPLSHSATDNGGGCAGKNVVEKPKYVVFRITERIETVSDEGVAALAVADASIERGKVWLSDCCGF